MTVLGVLRFLIYHLAIVRITHQQLLKCHIQIELFPMREE